MMACTALCEQQVMPQYSTLLEDGSNGPGIRNVQDLLERAWSEGQRCFSTYRKRLIQN